MSAAAVDFFRRGGNDADLRDTLFFSSKIWCVELSLGPTLESPVTSEHKKHISGPSSNCIA